MAGYDMKIIYLIIILLSGCKVAPNYNTRCKALGLESGMAKYQSFCIERRNDGMGVMLILPEDK